MEEPGIPGLSGHQDFINKLILIKRPFCNNRGALLFFKEKKEVRGRKNGLFLLPTSYFILFHALIKPLVEESCLLTVLSSCSSGRILLASCFPNSTPH
jgi:hypothetical protein